MVIMFLSCDDSLDEVYQDANAIVRSKLINSITEINSEEKPTTYNFKYDEKNRLLSFSNESEETTLEYSKQGELTNSKEVIENIFYIDNILQIPYPDESIEMYIVQKNEQGDPTLIKMYLTNKKGETRPVSVEITYDPVPNIYRPYLVAGGILAAADKEEPTAGRMLYFTSDYVPKYNLSSITYINKDAKEEHIFFLTNEYNNKKLVTKTVVKHLDVSDPGSSPKKETTTLLYSYVRD